MAEDPSLYMSQGDAAWLLGGVIAVWLVFYLLFCTGVGIIAKTKGRSFWGWMLLSVPITPLIAGIIVFVMEELPVIKRPPPPM